MKVGDLTQFQAQRDELNQSVAELNLHLKRFERTDEEGAAVVSAVNETLESLGRVRLALINIGEAAQVELLGETSNGQSNRPSSRRARDDRS